MSASITSTLYNASVDFVGEGEITTLAWVLEFVAEQDKSEDAFDVIDAARELIGNLKEQLSAQAIAEIETEMERTRPSRDARDLWVDEEQKKTADV